MTLSLMEKIVRALDVSNQLNYCSGSMNRCCSVKCDDILQVSNQLFLEKGGSMNRC